MGKIGFIKENKNNDKEGLKDKLHQKPTIKVIWQTTPVEEEKEEAKEVDAVEKIDTEIVDAKEAKKEELSNYFNLKIFYDFVNYKNVSIYNAMKFATDKNFCDRYYENKNSFLHSEQNKKKNEELTFSRQLYLQDVIDTICTRIDRRINKITTSNKPACIEDIITGKVLPRTAIEPKDIRYIKNNIEKLKGIAKEILELDKKGKFILAVKCIEDMAGKYEDFLEKNI